MAEYFHIFFGKLNAWIALNSAVSRLFRIVESPFKKFSGNSSFSILHRSHHIGDDQCVLCACLIKPFRNASAHADEFRLSVASAETYGFSVRHTNRPCNFPLSINLSAASSRREMKSFLVRLLEGSSRVCISEGVR